MLQAMRERAQGWIAGLIVAVLSMAFALWGVQYFITASSGTQVVATVNGEKITRGALEKRYGQIRQAMMMQLGNNFPTDPNFQKTLKKNALQDLINRTVISQAAYKKGFRVNEKQVIQEIKSNSGFQVKGRFSPERFQQVIQTLGYSQQEFMSEYAQSMMEGQLQAGIRLTSFSLPNEVNQALKLAEQERSFKYVIIPVKAFISSEKIADKTAKAFYEKNKQQFMDPLKVSISYIELTPNHFYGKIKPSEQQLKEYYKENANAFGPKSSYDAVKAQVKKQFLRHELEKAFVESSDQLSELVYTNPDTLTAAANELGVKIQTTGYFGEKGGKSGLTKNPKILKEAFGDEVLVDANNSNVIEVATGHLVVLRIKSKVEAKPKPFSEVKAQIIKQLMENAAKEDVKKFGEKLMMDLKNKKSITEILQKKKLAWKQEKNVTRQNNSVDMTALRLAFSAIDPKQTKQASLIGASTQKGDYILVQLEQVHEVAVDTNKQRHKVFAEAISNGFGKTEFDLFIKSLMDQAKIEIPRRH